MDDRTSVLAKETVELIAETLELQADTITLDRAIKDLSPDSIRLFELLLAFERKYAIQTTYEAVLSMVTVGDIVKYLVENTEVHIQNQ